jgi:hypothetical protein
MTIFLVFMFVTALLGFVTYGQASTSPIVPSVPPGSAKPTHTTAPAVKCTGMVKEFTPALRLIVRTETAEPLHYMFYKTVTYVTPTLSKLRKSEKIRGFAFTTSKAATT